MFRLGLLFACTITLGGCYASHLRTDDAGPPVDANLPDPVLALRRAWCESLPRCPLQHGGSGTDTPWVYVRDVDACIAHARSWWDEQIAEGRHLDADSARACAAAFGSSCLTDPWMRYVSLPPPCLAMFGDEGPALGEACTPSRRCAPGLFCDVEETPDCHAAVCHAPTGACFETCVSPPGALRASCDGLGSCIPFFEGSTGGVGATCGPGDEIDGRRVATGCDAGLLCEQPSLDPSTWHCVAPPGRDEPCAIGMLIRFCGPGTACSGSRDGDRCVPIEILTSPGAPCRSDAADACDSRLDLHCIAGSCQHALPGALGGTCEPERLLACGPSHFCGWETSTCIDFAPVPRPIGAECTTAMTCASGVCRHGVCAASCS